MRKLMTLALIASGSPALAASGPFFSLGNTDFIVLLAFLLFIAVLIYFKVPGLLGGMLDKRAEGIRNELDEARAIREEAQTLLASYERKQQEVKEQAARIVEHAKEEARLAGDKAQEDLKASIARRMAAAEDQIASAQAGAVKEVRDRAAAVAIAAAEQVIAKQMTAADAGKLIDDAIAQAGAKLH
ncbi:F0F1 ATP synthase subunit B [Primorskyibacter aestuariivivens]|uniref:F0F1 ATP synthase subunit B n=1 Tax=Primorskyibacter aestuariivivens TaxID=1888912 RepID=UPI002300E683|nr:F0F1 ATP synthase subunit B [Primorskyibacter aestuariivivens]MDA7428470.1 F0F1 ATP synthase subunit B [Primorskyibacter aestuariivivens]